jgi:beta-glucanase (GH16 family)
MTYPIARQVSRIGLGLLLLPLILSAGAPGATSSQPLTTRQQTAPLPPLPFWKSTLQTAPLSAPQITVLRAALSQTSLPPGATLNITAFFVAKSHIPANYNLSLALVDADGNTVAEIQNNLDNSLLSLPTTQWNGPVAVTLPITVPQSSQGSLYLMLSLSDAHGTVLVSAAHGLEQDKQARVYVGAITVSDKPVKTAVSSHLPVDPSQYALTFQDDFTSPSISDASNNDHSRWYAQNEQCCMMASDGKPTAMASYLGPDNPFHFTQPGGLTIQLKRQDNRWTSGVLTSVDAKGVGFSQQYGYFEMSARFPPGLNTWPSFWLLNTASKSSGAPAGEIDVVEYIANPAFPNYITTTLHDWSNKTTPAMSHHMVDLPSNGFHTYGMLWTATTMTFYFDGSITFECPTPPMMHQPYYLLFDLGLGAGWPTSSTPSTNDLQVQYIRVYQNAEWETFTPPSRHLCIHRR